MSIAATDPHPAIVAPHSQRSPRCPQRVPRTDRSTQPTDLPPRSTPGQLFGCGSLFLTCDSNLEARLFSDDVCDAVVCVMAARARDSGLTIAPSDGELVATRLEGWIHINVEEPERLMIGP